MPVLDSFTAERPALAFQCFIDGNKTMSVNEVPLFDAKVVNSGLDLEAAVLRVLRSHWYVLGDEVRGFEDEFAAYCGVPHCVTVANGTDAIELALRALGVGSGDVVLLAANAGYYGSTAVRLVGAQPVYVEIDQRTMNMDVAQAAELARAHRPKVILATHLYGQMADAQKLAELAEDCGCVLVEDCAQSHGARRDGSVAGSVGTIGCFSFYPTKNLGALGDGGAVICKDKSTADRIRSLRQYGWKQKYRNELPRGRNSRLDEMQAAVLREKLPLLDQHNRLRRDIAVQYCQAFSDLPLALPCSLGEDYVAHLMVVRSPRRDALQAHLRQRGVATDVHYPVPDHLQQVAGDECARVRLPRTEAACAEVLSLPCYPGMSSAQVRHVIDSVRSFFGQGTR